MKTLSEKWNVVFDPICHVYNTDISDDDQIAHAAKEMRNRIISRQRILFSFLFTLAERTDLK